MGGLQQSIIIRNEYFDIIANLSYFPWRPDKIRNGTRRPVPNINWKAFPSQVPGHAATLGSWLSLPPTVRGLAHLGRRHEVVTGVEVRYLRPALYGEIVAVTAWLERMGSRLLRFAYEVRRGDDRLASGATEHVWVERESRRPCRMPAALRQPFATLAGVETPSAGG